MPIHRRPSPCLAYFCQEHAQKALFDRELLLFIIYYYYALQHRKLKAEKLDRWMMTNCVEGLKAIASSQNKTQDKDTIQRRGKNNQKLATSELH